MQATLSPSNHTRSNLVSLGQNHGYRFEGDTAILNAELALAPLSDQDGSSGRGEHWALQLWACETPHQGGPLRGIKVAEAALALPQQGDHDYLEASAFAQLPPAQRDYSMVLVLASGSAGSYDQVHDFSNYPARQQFAAPHLEGSVGYRFEEDAVVLQAEGVRNPRAADNLSGSLSLQLWALREPYAGGAFEGVLLGSTELDRLAGQSEQRGVERRVWLTQAPQGQWQLALMLREWTEAAGYITRDFCNFAEAHHVEATFGAQPGAVETYQAPTSDEQPHHVAVATQRSNDDGTAVRHDDSGASESQADSARLALALHAEEQARQADLALRAEEAARAEAAARQVEQRAREEEAERAAATAREESRVRAAQQARLDEAARAEAHARAEKAAREAEVAERAIVAAREAAAVEQASAAARAASARADAEAEAAARAAMAVRAGKPVAKKAAAAASGNGAKKDAAPAVAETSKEAPRAASAARVSVQTASVDELASVPGLNKKLAAAIVRARPFTSLDDLRHVRGIGDKMLQQLRSALTL